VAFLFRSGDALHLRVFHLAPQQGRIRLSLALMTGTRVAIVVLILIAVIFFVGIGASLTREDDDTTPTDRDSIASALDQVPDFLRSLRRLPGGAARLELVDLLDLSSATIQAVPGSEIVTRVSTSQDEYRTAAFRLTDSSAPSASLEIEYQADCLPKGMETDDNKPVVLVPASVEEGETCSVEDKACVTLTIFECGGEIIFRCMGAGECEVQLRN
jgi:hypothetical protein